MSAWRYGCAMIPATINSEFNSDEVSHRFSVKITNPPDVQNRVGFTNIVTLRYKEDRTGTTNDAKLASGYFKPKLMGRLL